MPNYINRSSGYALVLPAPYTQKDVNVQLYVLQGRHPDIQDTVNRYLNGAAPAGTHYTALGDRVVGAFTAIKEIRCATPGLGFMHEVDCGFFIPVIQWENFVPRDVGFFAPYLFVNNSWAMATGREVHGFRKDVALSFSAQDVNDYDNWSHKAADLTHIDAWAMETKSAASRLQPHRLVEIVAPANAAEGNTPANAFLELVLAIMGSLGPLGGPLSNLPPPPNAASWLNVIAQMIIDKFTTTDAQGQPAVRLPIVFLRQFCDPASSTQADVQAVVQADMVVPISSVGATFPGGGYQVKFFHKDSHPIAAELGLDAVENSQLTVNADLEFQLLQAT